MFTEKDFEDVRPYNDNEINPALLRIISQPAFDIILDFLFPGQDKTEMKQKLAGIRSSHDFQLNFMHPLVNSIIKKTSDGLTIEGFDQLTPGTPYLFVANHRDIVLDSAILQVLLLNHGHSTSEITFGSNLMINKFIVDLGKVNRMFKVIRGGSRTELLRNSRLLSAYIRHTIVDKRVSVWIAQRPGRTKNGNDKTETSLLKMFNLSGGGNFTESFRELNIVPLVVSYEYEPCCSFKIKELLALSITKTYQKRPDEDFISIVTGITQPKGRIHLAVAKPVNETLQFADHGKNDNGKITLLAELIDKQVYSHYKLWPGNYIAHDMLNKSHDFEGQYTPGNKNTFLEYMENEIRGLEGERKIIEEIFLKIYSNPLTNLLRYKQGEQDN